MILTDAGPLIALVDADDPDHEACVAGLSSIILPMVTTWAAFTEAMYLLGGAGGIAAQQAFWHAVASGKLQLFDLASPAVSRSAELMAKFADTPMDLADATGLNYEPPSVLRSEVAMIMPQGWRMAKPGPVVRSAGLRCPGASGEFATPVRRFRAPDRVRSSRWCQGKLRKLAHGLPARG